MNKVLYTLAFLLLLIAMFAAFVWYFASVLDPSIPRSAEVDNLESSLEIDWYPYGAAVSVGSANDLDGYRATGFIHATRNAWYMSLLRQTATGKLGSWFDHNVSEIDSLSTVLGFAETSRTAYANLDQATAAILQAYSEGVNAAFQRTRSYRHESFLAVDQVPAPWEPWHSLAIEKLFAWISAAEALTEAEETTSRQVLKSTSKLMHWTEIGGLNNSAAWTIHNTDSTIVGVRYITGAGHTPVLTPVDLVDAAGNHTVRLTILGTPFSLFSRTTDHGIAYLPTSTARVRTIPANRSELEETFERVVNFRGEEKLLSRVQLNGDLVQECVPSEPVTPTIPPDPDILRCTVLEWPGLSPVTDAPRWKDQYDARFFQLWSGDALSFDRAGKAEMTGTTNEFRAAFGNRVRATGNTGWTPFLRSRLVQLTSSQDWQSGDISYDVKSTWAERWTQSLVANVDTASTASSLLIPALAYLRNWDYTYSGSSIAASILDAWALEAKKDSIDLFEIQGDSIAGTTQQLVRALDDLRVTFGPDLSDWRWESVNPHSFRVPAWSYILADSMKTGRYRQIADRINPATTVSGGHPSTLFWKPSSLSGPLSFPGAVNVSVISTSWEDIIFTTTRPVADASPRAVVDGTPYTFGFLSQVPVSETTLRPSAN